MHKWGLRLVCWLCACLGVCGAAAHAQVESCPEASEAVSALNFLQAWQLLRLENSEAMPLPQQPGRNAQEVWCMLLDAANCCVCLPSSMAAACRL